MSAEERRTSKMESCRFGFLLFLTAIVNAQMNGIVPSIQSYAALPYSQVQSIWLIRMVSAVLNGVAKYFKKILYFSSLFYCSYVNIFSFFFQSFL